MDNRKNIIIVTIIFLSGIFTFFGLVFDHILFHQHIIYAQIPCSSVGKTHMIIVRNNAFDPASITVKRCDKVVFINKDQHHLYQIAFGEHPKHIELPGFTEKVLGYNDSNEILLYNTGNFTFHDHLKDQAEGELVVK